MRKGWMPTPRSLCQRDPEASFRNVSIEDVHWTLISVVPSTIKILRPCLYEELFSNLHHHLPARSLEASSHDGAPEGTVVAQLPGYTWATGEHRPAPGQLCSPPAVSRARKAFHTSLQNWSKFKAGILSNTHFKYSCHVLLIYGCTGSLDLWLWRKKADVSLKRNKCLHFNC